MKTFWLVLWKMFLFTVYVTAVAVEFLATKAKEWADDQFDDSPDDDEEGDE